VGFVEKYFAGQFDLYNRYREGREDRVAFRDLWMLFDIRDTIYCPIRDQAHRPFTHKPPIPPHLEESVNHVTIKRYTPQAYRIMAVAGGMPYYRTAVAPGVKLQQTDDSHAQETNSSHAQETNSKT